ncbi:MAG: ADP-ribosylglycohydrolase family protein, partial [Candidatus Aminicenantales bacterium]
MKVRRFALIGLAVLVLGAACGRPPKGGAVVGPRTEISRSALLDKIKGGWAGQVIGCTFGGPTEFRYPGAMILDYQTIPWDDTI